MRFEAFSSTAHRYARLEWSDEKNESVYGDSFSREGLGHNFRLVLVWADTLAEDVKQRFQRANPALELIRKIDHKFLDENEAYFKNRVSSLENITEFLFIESQKLWPANVASISLYEGETLSAHCSADHQLILSKKYRTRSSQVVYDVEISFQREIDSESGLIIERPKLKELEQKHLSAIVQAVLSETASNGCIEAIAALQLPISSVSVHNALDGKLLKTLSGSR